MNGHPRDWRNHAACRSQDPELFFPVGDQGPARTQTAEARQVCQGCTVSEACLAFAILAGVSDGVWGGLSEDERRSMWRQHRGVVSSRLVRGLS